MLNFLSLKEAVLDSERHHIRLVMNACKNDKIKAAEVLEISVSSLYRKIEELKLKGEFR